MVGVQLLPLLVKEVNKEFVRSVGGILGQGRMLSKNLVKERITCVLKLSNLEIFLVG